MESTVFNFEEALAAERRGDLEAALQCYNEAVAQALSPQNQGEALFHRGSLYFRLGEYQKALADLNRCIKLSTENSEYLWEALMNCGMSRALTGDLSGAEEDLVKSIELEPANGLAYLNLAGLKIRRNDKQGASLCLNMARTTFTQQEDDAGVEAVEGLMAQLS